MAIRTERYKDTQRAEFKEIFPSVIEIILKQVHNKKLPLKVTRRFKECLQYNTDCGKLNRGISVPDTGRIILGRPLSEDEFKALSILDWLTELLQAFFLIHDDIMDASMTRRGQIYWYLQPHMGLMAVNDGVLLESSVFTVLKSEFRDHPAYLDMIEAFNEAAFNTQLDQLCDLMTAPDGKTDLRNFSMEKYATIVQYKTAYYSFYLPVALALYWLQLASPENLDQAHDILIPMGEYFQVQDDYLDLFGDPDITGKIGTDIRDNKCLWLIIQALLRATPEQRRILDESYGRKDNQCEMKVQKIFSEMDLQSVYRDFETNRIQKLERLINAVDETDGLRKDIFTAFLAKISRRSS